MTVKLSKAQKFALAVIVGLAVVLYASWSTGTVSLNWNDLFNGTLQTILGSFIGMAITIWVYRFLYHRGSKK